MPWLLDGYLEMTIAHMMIKPMASPFSLAECCRVEERWIIFQKKRLEQEIRNVVLKTNPRSGIKQPKQPKG